MKHSILLAVLLLAPLPVQAASPPAATLYGKAIDLAAAGNDGEASAQLKGGASLLPDGNLWRGRMQLAASLLDMRRRQQVRSIDVDGSPNAALASAYMKNWPAPEAESDWMATALAVLLPGSGHAWLGRLHDALTAALLVWPMLLLTLWAAYRRMGPVTVFFAMITAWLWSGTVFSVVSLGERTGYEAYLLWWQGLWQASALPGRPW